jgi:hypothetical protein
MNLLIKLATGRNILLLIILFLLANFVIIPFIYPTFQTLDTLPSYTPQKAYELISSYGDQGRQTYIVTELTLDLIYPFISALLFSLLILYTFQRGFPGKAWLHRFAWIPFGVMIADYLENICVVIMLLSYPRELPTLAQISNLFTIIKFALTPFELVFLVGLIGWLTRTIRVKHTA